MVHATAEMPGHRMVGGQRSIVLVYEAFNPAHNGEGAWMALKKRYPHAQRLWGGCFKGEGPEPFCP